LWVVTATLSIFIAFSNTYHVGFVPCNFSVQRKNMDFQKEPIESLIGKL